MKEELKELKKETMGLSTEELAQVNGGKQPPIDMNIQNESVPVRDGDPCPRCPDWVHVVYNSDGTPECLACHICGYYYTPTDGKFYSFDL